MQGFLNAHFLHQNESGYCTNPNVPSTAFCVFNMLLPYLAAYCHFKLHAFGKKSIYIH